MATNETDAERWTRRAKDAATEAFLFGTDPDAIRAAVEAGIREGQRIAALRAGASVPEPRQAAPVAPAPGSAIAALLAATR